MTSALSDYDALALLASWECIEALRDLYCIACIQQMQNKHQPKSSSMLQSQATCCKAKQQTLKKMQMAPVAEAHHMLPPPLSKLLHLQPS